MKVLFITNIPAPYRMKFFEGLGEHIDLTVLYEAKKAKDIKFSYEDVVVSTYKEIYLSDGYIHENIPNPKIITFLLRNKFDLIFLNNYRYATEMLAYILVKVLKTTYCIEIDGGRIKKESKITYGFKRWLLSGAIAYFSPAKSADDFFIHYGVSTTKLVRYPFTSITKDYIINQKDLQIKLNTRKDEPLTFLYVGRIIPEKGISILIESYNEFCLISKIKSKLIIVGNAPNTEYYNHIDSMRNNSTIIYDFVPSKELIDFYNQSDVLIFPSLYDPWGLVINEAMARGLIILSSDTVVSAVELIEEEKNGLLFNVQNDSLKYSIEKLVTYRERFDGISIANITKIKNYTIEEMVLSHLRFIHLFEKKE